MMIIKHDHLGIFFRKILITRKKNFIKKDLEIYIYIFFYWRKLSRLRGKFCSTALVIDTFYVKYCSVLMQYDKFDLLIEITFLNKKNIYISRSFFYAVLCDWKLGISCLSISTCLMLIDFKTVFGQNTHLNLFVQVEYSKWLLFNRKWVLKADF